MSDSVRLLLVEDSGDDAELMIGALSDQGIKASWKRVETEAEFIAELEGRPDCILADYRLPVFSGVRALQILSERELDIPVIVVSGTVGDEQAAQLITLGATDFLLKDRLARLGAAVTRALELKRVRDERRQAERQVIRLSRVHAVLSGINSLIVRVVNREDLFKEACRIAVDHGKFAMAWIGLLDPDTQEVVPQAWAGAETEDLVLMKVSARGDLPDGQGLVGQAIRERKAAYDNDIVASPRKAGARRAEVVRRGYRSLIALPLIVDGAVVGNFSLYSREPGFFNDAELRLLSELASDISFALQYIAKEEKINYLAYRDGLTGLPNRTLFQDRCLGALHRAKEDSRQVALIALDIKRFRFINETFGRHTGDAVLQALAERLRQVWPDPELICRSGGDDFFGLLEVIREPANAAHFIENELAEILRKPFTAAPEQFHISVRAGISIFPADGESPEPLLRNAEAALAKAKATGASYLFYRAEMNATVAGVLLLENRMRRAVEKNQFVLHYQPKLDLMTGNISGLEALIRWNDPETGLVPPLKFIPLLEETGMILEVGAWAIRQALQDSRDWMREGLPAQRVAVNVSPIQLRQADFIDRVSSAISEIGGAAHGLDIEITESVIMEDIEANIARLQTLRDMGVNLAIDDFGTGYSSLSYLAKLPVNALKIDRSFIVGMAADAHSMTIVSTTISLAHSLNLKVIAEGVDSEDQKRLLRLLKCDEMQGYLFSKPVPKPEITALLRQHVQTIGT